MPELSLMGWGEPKVEPQPRAGAPRNPGIYEVGGRRVADTGPPIPWRNHFRAWAIVIAIVAGGWLILSALLWAVISVAT